MKIKIAVSLLIIIVLAAGIFLGCENKSQKLDAIVLDRKRDLDTGETLMAGNVSYTKNDMYAFSFILSAVKSSIRDVCVDYIKGTSSGSNNYSGMYPISNGKLDIELATIGIDILKDDDFVENRLTLTFNDNFASGTIVYSDRTLNVRTGSTPYYTYNFLGAKDIEFTLK